MGKDDDRSPPGRPGMAARWSASRKVGVGTAVNAESPVWFTLSNGILNEIYYPRLDCANTRDLGLLVSAEGGFFSEEKRDTEHRIEPLEQGVPGYRLTNTCKDGRYRITKEVITDPWRPALLMRVTFEALRGRAEDYRVFVLAAPHPANSGNETDGWAGDFRGESMLFARAGHVTLALTCSVAWRARSCGYVGVNDGWQLVKAHGRLAEEHAEARRGNVALSGEVDLAACGGEFTVVAGFGDRPMEAGHVARAVRLTDYARMRAEFIRGWREFQDGCLPLERVMREAFDVYRVSTAVLRTHESKLFRGAIIASLSIPWGEIHGDRDIGGYHLVWPRDLLHAGMALVAAGRVEDARNAMFYLQCTQEPEGSWTQNMWVDGDDYWTGRQNDQTAAFILLIAALKRAGGLGPEDPWPAARRAAECLLRHGPATEQDRWEENPGYTPYTLAHAIAALLEAAELAEERGERELAERCRGTADEWNASIERWLYVTDTPLSREAGVEGYYVRIAPPETESAEELRWRKVRIKNRAAGERAEFEAWEIASPDALALVRLGLRRPDDPRILNTVKVIDASVRREMRTGPGWKRYTHDGYGETEAGEPFSGAGVGRCWTLLTGERAHYELARGNRAETERLLRVMVEQGHEGGLLSEQVWDGEDMPEKQLFNGEPTGAAMPLVWAHAELVLLLRSLRDGEVFDLPEAPARRYLGQARPRRRAK